MRGELPVPGRPPTTGGSARIARIAQNDDALGALATMGEREGQLDEVTIASVSSAAAQERRRVVAATRAATDEPSRKWWRFAGVAVAAAVVIIATAAGTFTRPEQVVVTGELDPATQPPANPLLPPPTTGDPSAAESTAEATPEPAEIETASDDAIRAAPPTIADAADDDASPAPVAEASSQEPPQETAPTTTPATESTTTPTQPSTSSAPPVTAEVATVALPVGRAGTVNLNMADGVPTITDVNPAPGWTHAVSTIASGHLIVVFSDGVETATFEVRSSDAGFQLLVDPGDRTRVAFTETRLFDFGEAGSVLVEYGSAGLTGIDARPAPGWRPVVSTPATDLLDIELVGPRTYRRYTAEVLVGAVYVQIAAGG